MPKPCSNRFKEHNDRITPSIVRLANDGENKNQLNQLNVVVLDN